MRGYYSSLDSVPDRLRASRRRLAASYCLSILVIALLLTVFEYALQTQFEPVESQPLDVTIETPNVVRETAEIVEPPSEELPASIAPVEITAEARPEAAEIRSPSAASRSVDWYQMLESAASNSDKLLGVDSTMDAEFDERRRNAAVRFAKSGAPVKKPIWENVEKDQLGRTLLVSGDCHRVIDDPSAVRQWEFRNFHQFIVFCSSPFKEPKELPWVAEVRERYDYLQKGFPFRGKAP